MGCTGEPYPCSFHGGQGPCEYCGCWWDEYYWECEEGVAEPCHFHGDEGTCLDCGCDWTALLNIKVNYADIWGEGVEGNLNVADVWREVLEIWENINNVWKRVF